jgi:hypothetical protein
LLSFADPRDDPWTYPVASIRCPRVQTRKGEVSLANPVPSLSVLENFKLLAKLQQSRTVPAIVRRNLKNYAAPPAPTEASEIFTPGPMVEEMEIFFI